MERSTFGFSFCEGLEFVPEETYFNVTTWDKFRSAPVWSEQCKVSWCRSKVCQSMHGGISPDSLPLHYTCWEYQILELDSTLSQSWIEFWNWIFNFNQSGGGGTAEKSHSKSFWLLTFDFWLLNLDFGLWTWTWIVTIFDDKKFSWRRS